MIIKQIYIVITLFAFAFNASAQSLESNSDQKIPLLNGHAFMSSSYLGTSFATTHVQADIGFGLTSKLVIPGIMIGDHELFSFEGTILYVDLGVQYQQRFTPWLGLYMSFKMAGRLGGDFSTIVADGVNTLVGGDIGWLIRIKQTEKFNLAGTISVNNITGNFINVVEYIEEIIDDNPYPSIIKKVPSMSVGLGLRAAYAFNPTIGLQFQLDYAYGESLLRGASQGYFSTGLLADFDFNPKYNVPIGLGAGYALSTAAEIVMNAEGASNLILGKISYTGSKDFDLGLQFTYYDVQIVSVESKPFVNKILLTLKFYF